jgi:hypothetical protein
MAIEDRVQRLEDRDELKELRYEYARCLDDEAFGEWVDLFVPDAECDYEGWGEVSGHDELSAFAEEVDEAFEYTAHLMLHPQISVDGDRAEGTWYTVIRYALSEGRGGWRQGRYHDTYVRTDAGWKFETVSHTFFARHLTDYESGPDERYGHLVDFE